VSRLNFSSKAALGALALCIGAACAAAPAPAASGAMPACHAMHGMRGDHDGPRSRPGRMLDFMLHRVEATPQQRDSIHAIEKSAREQGRAHWQQLRELHQQGMALLAASDIDTKALEALRVKRMALQDQMSRQMLQTEVAIAKVLTPAQRQQMLALMQRHEHGGDAHRWHGEAASAPAASAAR
jgi:Spy/CpxP family protein refolding chaperone